ncbi:MAG: hypothetical protein D6733_04635 [Methanobacteriota archaeon]|nr:MAG: hypothetical protein D6733_04635 [Euryarchaeota archaeon]
MPEIVFVLRQNRADVVEALRMKAALERQGIRPYGIIMVNGEERSIPPEFVEQIMGLETVGFIDRSNTH